MASRAAIDELKPIRHGNVATGAIVVAAILLFVGTGSMELARIFHKGVSETALPDWLPIIALLFNVALILVSWRRHSAFAAQIAIHTAAEQRAQQLAARDPLTGFLNRRSFPEEGATAFSRAHKQGKALALLMLDLDHFKTVNDMHGHLIGDALLCQVAEAMIDRLPQAALLARFGGDEFACTMTFDPTYPDAVTRVADQLVSRLAQPFCVDGLHLHVGASIGIARSDFDCSNIDSLTRSADIAMYAAKKAGRNRFAWFDLSMERELKARNDLETGLRSAIPAEQIVPYFEKQIDLVTGGLRGFEVLARWEHPARGLISPDLFIPIAEESGLIAELSLSVMRQAFIAARDWHPSLTLSINISPWQLRDPWLAQKIIKLIAETGFPASRLEIEVTESALFENLALAQSIVGSLKNQGILLALDDFGTGYSSLAHLRALPFDRIKIDRSFITSINENAESAAIVNAITRLGDSLNLPITAEGIENAVIEKRLRALGCSKGQGWLYGKPLSIAHVRQHLAERRLLEAQSSWQEKPATSQRLAG